MPYKRHDLVRMRSKPANVRNSCDLPMPDGPRIPTRSPASICKLRINPARGTCKSRTSRTAYGTFCIVILVREDDDERLLWAEAADFR
eukprot:scaffold1029_cov194-Amphora_coffeaeformis.AAC.11